MEYQLTRSFSVQHLSLALYSLGITSVLLHSSGTLPLSPFEIQYIFSCFDFFPQPGYMKALSSLLFYLEVFYIHFQNTTSTTFRSMIDRAL